MNLKKFNYNQPTEIRFGWGRIDEVGEAVAQHGKRCLLVTGEVFHQVSPAFKKITSSLEVAGIELAHFDGITPNPTTDSITTGAGMAREHKADVVLGVGGGSSLDSAKAIAVEASHDGSCWDYLFFREHQPTKKTLPVITVNTTSGTGSQVTQVAVVTNPAERCKSALYHPFIFPRVGIVDPELMITVPERMTAITGFDVFTHAFESLIHSNASSYTDMMAKEAITIVVQNLQTTVTGASNKAARIAMAWADTLAGLCIANAGVTLPHGISMAIGGLYPHVAHAEALATVYPAFTRYTFNSAIEQFAVLGRILNKELITETNEVAAGESCSELDNFLKSIELWTDLKQCKIPVEELPDLAHASLVLPDYKNNPRIASYNEILDLLHQCYDR